jgi:hypothetical protein
MLTRVSWGGTVGQINSYELQILCEDCEAFWAEVVRQEQQRKWWRGFWACAIVGNILLMSFLPVSWFPLLGLILWRVGWKHLFEGAFAHPNKMAAEKMGLQKNHNP